MNDRRTEKEGAGERQAWERSASGDLPRNAGFPGLGPKREKQSLVLPRPGSPPVSSLFLVWLRQTQLPAYKPELGHVGPEATSCRSGEVSDEDTWPGLTAQPAGSGAARASARSEPERARPPTRQRERR